MAKQGYVVYTADKIKNRKKRIKRAKIIIGIVFLLLMLTFVVLSLTYNGGAFTVTLDPNFHTKAGMAIYIDDVGREHVRRLYANELKFMDNISVEWLPKDYKDYKGGDHNGDNYIAYTFYIENQGTEIQNYWYSVYIDDVIKNVDEAIRVKIVLNDEEKIYAKANPLTGEAEKGTEIFYKNNIPVMENRTNFKPGDIDKITVFIWLEGDDPECVDNLLGGEIKMHMEITEEHIEENKDTQTNTDEFNRVHDNENKDNQYDDSVKADTNYDNNRVEGSNNVSENNTGLTETEDNVKADVVDDTIYRNTVTGNVNGG